MEVLIMERKIGGNEANNPDFKNEAAPSFKENNMGIMSTEDEVNAGKEVYDILKDRLLHPENKCANLLKDFSTIENPLKEIFERQEQFQISLGRHVSENPEDAIASLKENWLYLTLEFAELMDRLPYKHWKKYTNEDYDKAASKENLLECQFELIDMSHFFINMCLAMGINWELFRDLYLSKNKENFDRQKKGY
jgi:hypothetical protein